MFIEHMVWRHLIFGDIRRVTYGIKNNDGYSSDHAIEFGNVRENPGLWTLFTDGKAIPIKSDAKQYNKINDDKLPLTFDIHLDNSVNYLKLWQGKNPKRGDRIKINQNIHGTKNEDIIEVWYYGYMKVLLELLEKINKSQKSNEESRKLETFIKYRLQCLKDYNGTLFSWCVQCKEEFSNLNISTKFLQDDEIEDIKSFIQDYYLIVIRYRDKGIEKTDALMANVKEQKLHPVIKEYLMSNESGRGFALIQREVK